LIPQLKQREIPIPEHVIDMKGIPGLEAITYDEEYGLKIGPLTTMSAIERSPVMRERFSILVQAASSMASPQIRNRGTFAGNICSAVPSADSVPALMVMGARVVLKAMTGDRMVPLDQFFRGPRKTVMQEDEMLLHILVPQPAPATRGVYLKLSPRHSMDLAIVGVAAAGSCENGICSHIKIALGAVAPTPVRAPVAEAMLQGQKVTPAIINEAAKNVITQCSPIDDHRASAEYRCDMLHVLTRRALTQVLLPQGGK
jgi:carbon-monoxide dehydrogenase medium subunit